MKMSQEQTPSHSGCGRYTQRAKKLRTTNAKGPIFGHPNDFYAQLFIARCIETIMATCPISIALDEKRCIHHR